MIPSMSMRQALNVWEELVDAYHGRNGYGSDTAEIYAYRLLERSPSAEASASFATELHRKAIEEQASEAAFNLACLLHHFRETHNGVRIAVEGVPFTGVRSTPLDPFDHRVHVKVIR